MMTPEQFAQFQQQQLHALHELTLKYVSSLQLLTELHLQHTKNSLEAHNNHQQALLQVKSLDDLLAVQRKNLQPVTEKLTDYTRHFYDILFGLGHEASRLFDWHRVQVQDKPESPTQATPTPVAAPIAKTATKSGNSKNNPSA